jgi:hypothetical protein
MKILGISKAGNMWLLGTGEADGKWFFLGEAVLSFAKTFKRGDEVEVTTESKDGKNFVTYIKAGTKAPSTQSQTTSASPSGIYTKPTYGKSAEEQNSIKRQAIGNMTSRTIIGLQGLVDVNNIHDIIKAIYKTYEEIIG